MLPQDVSTDFCIAENGGFEVVVQRFLRFILPCVMMRTRGALAQLARALIQHTPVSNLHNLRVLAHPVERSYGIAEVASSSLAHSTITSDKNSLGTVRLFIVSQFQYEAGFFL